MKLVCRKLDGKIFETDLPRRNTKHRVPQMGGIVEFADDNSVFRGEVMMVEHKYKQSLGSLKKTEVVVSVNELDSEFSPRIDHII